MLSRKPRLLIVEDEAPIRSGLTDVFLFHGYEVDTAADGREGLRKAQGGGVDLVLLDLMLPGLSGLEVCERVRAGDKELPIIMLTAKSSDEDVIQGLRLGADDYVAKPFSVTQLVARVEAVLRRSRPLQQASRELRLGPDLLIDTTNLSGCRGAETLQFTLKEMEILSYLAEHSERPVPREELLAKIWGYRKEMGIETRTVDIHIAKLRRKIEDDPGQPTRLLTIRGAGYRLLVG